MVWFRRRCLWLVLSGLFAASTVLLNLCFFTGRFTDSMLYNYKISIQEVNNHRKEVTINSFQDKSSIYTANKTNFDDSFPPNSKKALTLNSGYLIGNFKICEGTDHVAYIVVVHSAVQHQSQRQSIRSTWGRQNLIPGLPSKTIFLVGQIDDEKAQQILINENNLHRDIIQGEFIDSHQNMTLKNVMGLRWLSNYCSHAKFIVKADDDVFVDIFQVRKIYFNDLEISPKRIICKVGVFNDIFRTKDYPPGEPSTVSDEFFKGLTHYPMPWCYGFIVFMKMDLAKELYQAAMATPAYPLDDVYVYGILASTVKGTSWRNEENKLSKDETQTISHWGCDRTDTFIAGTFRSDDTAKKLWHITSTCWQNITVIK